MNLSDKIGRIIEQHEVGLIRYVTGILRDREQARDIVQDALIRLLREYEKGNEVQNEKAWLYRVSHNRALDHIRKFKRRTDNFDDVLPAFENDSVKSPDEELDLKEQKELILASLKELNQREQKIIEMKVRDNKSYKDIADTLDLTVSNVGFILHRAMKKLAVVFKEKSSTDQVKS